MEAVALDKICGEGYTLNYIEIVYFREKGNQDAYHFGS